MARVSFLGALLLVSLFASLATRDARAQELLLINGGFESGTKGWHPFGGEVRTEAGLGARNTTAGLLRAVGDNPATRIEQPVEVFQPGATYRLTGQVRVGGSNVQYASLKLEWRVAGVAGLAAPSAQEDDTGASYWPLETSPLYVPCDAGVLVAMVDLRRYDATGAVAYAYIDDLSLEAVPPAVPCPTPTRPPLPTQLPPGSTSPAPTDPPGGPPTGQPGAAAPPLPMTSLLANGGFEVAQAGRPAGWRTQGGVLGQVASPVHGGRFAAAFASASDSTKWAYQTVPVTALAWYELDGYVSLNDSGVEGALLRVSWYASTDGSGSALANVDSTEELVSRESRYRYLTTGPMQAPPGARSAKARVLLRPRSASGGVIYIDDVALWPSEAGAAPGEARAASERSSVRSSGGQDGPGGSRVEGGASFVEQPTPVVRRGERSGADAALPSGGGASWWPWALAGTTVVAGAGGFGAYRWRRR
ncbi:MAG: hypothetical protein WEE64_08345 [Dehalococcoidia bacterium]